MVSSNKAGPAEAGIACCIGRQHLSHSLDVWPPCLLHHLQTQAHQISSQAKSAGAAIQRQINRGLAEPSWRRKRLPIKADLANRTAIRRRRDQQQSVGIGQPLTEPVVMI